MRDDRIPVIDLFAGPGGLGEGFAAWRDRSGLPAFRLALSIEKDPVARETLRLRAFFREFACAAQRELSTVPEQYYDHLRRELDRAELYDFFPNQAEAADHKAWHAELGRTPAEQVDERIERALAGAKTWVLIGGPPCQAYSVIGRSRMGGIRLGDHRVHLYREYLRILAVHRPSAFVMENVPGILSSHVKGEPIFSRILSDLAEPTAALHDSFNRKSGRPLEASYRLWSLVKGPATHRLDGSPAFEPGDFRVRCERHGIPQARHRVLILGIRDNVRCDPPKILPACPTIPIEQAIEPLPRLRSGLSEDADSKDAWYDCVSAIRRERWFRETDNLFDQKLRKRLLKALRRLKRPRHGRGREYLPVPQRLDGSPTELRDWLLDERLGGVCNHSTRSHLVQDLYRYFYAAGYASVHDSSPDIAEFPKALWPKHKSMRHALNGGAFNDRFRVQVAGLPATTITSHIAKDGHYYIHYDATQCRSLTVREAARLQTFPDNYFFCGPRTAQYVQVGNAVPPLLARRIAGILFELLDS